MSYKAPALYDTPIDLLRLPDRVGTPIQGKLLLVESCWARELTVYHQRYWEAVQAGSVIDTMVELPLHRDIVRGRFVRFKGHIYTVEQAQPEYDDDGLPITTLSLSRSEDHYDIARP